jgi:hypothetical protein
MRGFALTMMLFTCLVDAAGDGGTPTVPRSAEALNAEGEAFYKQGRLQLAADRFWDAFTANPRLAIAHYNYAATVFRSLQADGCAVLGQPVDEATSHLELSTRFDEARIQRLKVDPDFKAHARHFLESWHYSSGLLEPLVEGLRKAGLEMDGFEGLGEPRGESLG